VRADVIQHRRHETRDAYSGGGADGCADEREQNPLPDDEARESAMVRAEGHANAELAGAASDFVGQQTVKADGGEHQREGGEETGEPGHEALLEENLVDLFSLGAHVAERQVVTSPQNDFADVFHQRSGVRRNAQFEMRAVAYKRQKYDGRGFPTQLGVLSIAHDTDDSVAGAGTSNLVALDVAHVQTDGILIRKIFPREGLVDDERHGR